MMNLRISNLSDVPADKISRIITGERNMLEEFREAEKKAAVIIDDIVKNGDEALLKYTREYDNIELRKEDIEVTQEEMDRLSTGFDEDFIKALRTSIERVERFHRKDLPEDWFLEDEYNSKLGQKYLPIEKVGVYVPGGKALYPSSVIMTAVPAVVAGVERLYLGSPPSSFRQPSEICLAVKLIGGFSGVYRAGGVQIIAAMAFGTEMVEKVDKIIGPGNIYVAAAKRLLYGVVDIDMIAGPSEIVVIWDGSVDVGFVAADLLAQAEHDEDAEVICIVFNEKHADEVRDKVLEMISGAKRRGIIERSLSEKGRIYIVKNRESALALINAVAPEHLEIITEDADIYLDGVKNAGAIFLGAYSPVALGDYIAGPSHVLPTGRTARFFSPLNVRSFFKLSSVIKINSRGCYELGRWASIIAEREELSLHRYSIEVRKKDRDFKNR